MSRLRSKQFLLTAFFAAVVLAGLALFWPHAMQEDAPRSPASEIELKFKDVDRRADPKRVAREVFEKSGIDAKRARKVVYDSDPLRAALWPGERAVVFDLFNDVKLRVRFMEPSVQLNRRGEFVGQVDGDPESRVQIWSTVGRITGEIVTSGRTFRFVPDTGGVHFIVEVGSKAL